LCFDFRGLLMPLVRHEPTETDGRDAHPKNRIAIFELDDNPITKSKNRAEFFE